MVGCFRRRLRQNASDDRPRQQIWAEERGGNRRVAKSAQPRRSGTIDWRGPQYTPEMAEAAGVRCGLPGGAQSGVPTSCGTAPAGDLGGRHDSTETLIDPGAPASVKVRAAEAIFNHAAKAIEIEDIEARVAALERAVPQGNPRR